jgi:putative ATP-dependent endonuclease of OLD family
MRIEKIYFQGHACFKTGWSGFDTVKPINVIIGRNNTGKSKLLDLVRAFLTGKYPDERTEWRLLCHGTLDEKSLRQAFPEVSSGGQLYGNHWRNHGERFIGLPVSWEFDRMTNQVENVSYPDSIPLTKNPAEAEREKYLLNGIIGNAHHFLFGKEFHRLLADRDIRPEISEETLELQPDGRGATNIIRRYLNSAAFENRRKLVANHVLDALNLIFGEDGHFTEIQIKEHDNTQPPSQHMWEIYIRQEKKGLIPLRDSGSGLKTVILVLTNLLVRYDVLGDQKRSNFAFAFEELENNLHPTVLRRLLRYIEDYAVIENVPIFLTTHSSVALDLFGPSPNAQIIHVSHDGESARTTTVKNHFDQIGVIAGLGAKPSDLLQANGIIWVEGPSDAIYINKWLHLFSNGELLPGRDYQCAFYGGSLLARTQFTSPDKEVDDLVNLFRINPHIAVICDSDKSSKTAKLKDRVRRIQEEVKKIPRSHIWITSPKEIENYLPGEVIGLAYQKTSLPDPEQFECFFPKKVHASNYFETNLKLKSVDKMELAIQTSRLMTLDSMQNRFDWSDKMTELVQCIKSWNQ